MINISEILELKKFLCYIMIVNESFWKKQKKKGEFGNAKPANPCGCTHTHTHTHTHTCILMPEKAIAVKALLVYKKISNWEGFFDDPTELCKSIKIVIV